MNRTEFKKTLEELGQDIENKDANFVAEFGDDPEMMKNARVMAGVALMAVDRYYSNLSKRKAELKEI